MGMENEKLVDELRRIHDGDAWHGPALRELLSGLTPEQANARPIEGGHNIWELVLHIRGWENVFLSRIKGDNVSEPPEGDFPDIEQATQKAWDEALSGLDETHAKLISVVENLDDRALEERVAGYEYTVRFLLDGVTRHHVYHTGQIALLRKAFVR